MKTTIRKISDNKVKSKAKTAKDDVPMLSKKEDKEKSTTSKSTRNAVSNTQNTLSTPRNTLSTPRNILSTPRNYTQKSSTTDIYVQKKNIQTAKAPRKSTGATNKTSSLSPMKDLLKSSSSSVSHSNRLEKKVSKKDETKESDKTVKRTPRLAKDLPYANVTVNSPAPKKKLDLNLERTNSKNSARNSDNDDRQRSKTRTLKEDEVKVLTPEIVDNNAEMINLSRRLGAQPKAFFVDLEDEKKQSKVQADETSDEQVSYEDDFESYESDFDSYHSESNSTSSNNEQPDKHSDSDNNTQSQHADDDDDDIDDKNNVKGDQFKRRSQSEKNKSGESGKRGDLGHTESEDGVKDLKDDERMLDSGNFDLRESQRSANRAKPAAMDFILEDGELDVKTSLTDEGFQEMSSSSAVSSMRTLHVDVLDRPLFIDFTKSKENKRKRRIFERLKQRAEDILSMVTLHEMSYSLFEMQPITYDVYMATFGRSNYMQTAVQTFEDGITEEVQTEETECDVKWTQCPVDFSNHDIYLTQDVKNRKYSQNLEDYLTKFTILINETSIRDVNDMNGMDENYKLNPLRIYLEQKDGVGNGKMLQYDSYNSKFKNNEFNVNRLKKFMKKAESRISHVLTANANSEELPDIVKTSKYPFSKGFVTLTNQNVTDEKISFIINTKIVGVIYSENKNNLILTIHKASNTTADRCTVCLWNLSVARREPVKILTAIDNIVVGRFRGGTDGVFVAALEDGSIHLWDLSEEPMWQNSIASDEKTTNLVEINAGSAMTQIEKDREWNLKNSQVVYNGGSVPYALQTCAYTSSACNLLDNTAVDRVVGLELDCRQTSRDVGSKFIGQVCVLQRIGILTIWSIIQEKLKTNSDIGKAFWSKMKLQKSQTISLVEYINVGEPSINSTSFNLNAAKRRVLLRKKERTRDKKGSRPKSAVSFDRPTSAASIKKTMLPIENNWENGIVCSDLKIMKYNNTDNFLIAKNCGEVLCCTKNVAAVKVNRLSVASDATTVTCLEVSQHGLPYFLAATDVGTVNLCSVLDARVLLTLDTRNYPERKEMEKYQSDSKGRYVGSVTVDPHSSPKDVQILQGISVKSVYWSTVNPCCVYTLLREGTLVSWDLAHSDIYAASVAERAALALAASADTLALLTPEGEVQIHRLVGDRSADKYLQLFMKYITLL
ncbi:uncharacterized protein LOC113510041 [Galleria mellonella]|uniref:Uncharacterized protein LOC113510041 n=1 Tax=Galleria mellonella TaxID=7137 RepID=A0A6J3C5X6_GALME|nr:uncharacterized protein LOC113510041 [Galleria mellonella]